MSSGIKSTRRAPPFAPSGLVVLASLPTRQKEEWYDFLLQENVQFNKMEPDQEAPGHAGSAPRPAGYVAHIRVVSPSIPKERAVPPDDGTLRIATTTSMAQTHKPPRRKRGVPLPPQPSSSSLPPSTSAAAGVGAGAGFHEGAGESIGAQGEKEGEEGDQEVARAEEGNDDKRNVVLMKFGRKTIDLTHYHRVTSLLHGAGPESARPRLLPWLMKAMEELYEVRYHQDVTDLLQTGGEDDGTLDGRTQRGSLPFPEFVLEHFRTVHGLRMLMEQGVWDLLLNSAAHRSHSLPAELFSRFLEESYDVDDLLFFLYVRSVVEKVLRASFKARWAHDKQSESGSRGHHPPSKGPKQQLEQPPLSLSYRQCVRVCQAVFGSEDDPYSRRLLRSIEPELKGGGRGSVAATAQEKHQHGHGRQGHQGPSTRNQGPRSSANKGDKSSSGRRYEVVHRIDAYYFLFLAVSSYHQGRPEELEELGDLTRATEHHQRHQQHHRHHHQHHHHDEVLLCPKSPPAIMSSPTSPTALKAAGSPRGSHHAAARTPPLLAKRLDEYLKAIGKDHIAAEEGHRSSTSHNDHHHHHHHQQHSDNPHNHHQQQPHAPQQEKTMDGAGHIMQLQLSLEKSYVDELMEDLLVEGHDGGEGGAALLLHPDILREIRCQLSTQLHDRVSERLRLIQEHQHSPPPMSTLRDMLAAVVGDPSLMQGAGMVDANAATTRGMLQAIMLDPALRGETEMLLRLLVNLATQQQDDDEEDVADATIIGTTNLGARGRHKRSQQQQQQQPPPLGQHGAVEPTSPGHAVQAYIATTLTRGRVTNDHHNQHHHHHR